MIERRELLMAGAGLAAAGTLAVPAAAQQHRMEGMAMSMTDCIDDCVASHRMCLETAAWLTKQGGASATASLIAMLNECGTVPGDRQLDAAGICPAPHRLPRLRRRLRALRRGMRTP